MRNLACEPSPDETLDRLLWSFAFRNFLTAFDFIYNFHMAIDMPALAPACLPLLCPSFWVLFYQTLHVKAECEKHWREENKGCLEVTLEHQELQVSSWVCRGCSIFQIRRALQSILHSRKVRKISVTNQGTPKWVFFSLGNLSREFYMLSIAMIHAFYYVSQHTIQLLKHFHSLVI